MKPLLQIDNSIKWGSVHCVYIAKNEEQIREHAKRAGFPVDRIEEIKNMTGPERGL